MPIEYGNVSWPPAECARPNELYETWGAWYSGDPDELTRVYGGGLGASAPVTDKHPLARPASSWGGWVARLAPPWWGRPTSGAQPQSKLHLPAAGDLSMYAADILFGAPPDVAIGAASADGTPTAATARFDKIAEDAGLFTRLLEAAELCSAYGGVYIRVTVPPEVNGFRPVEAPVWEAIAPDVAIPEWSFGFLVAVTFWREVYRKGGKDDGSKATVWRHLEKHEPGVIYHALYAGTSDRLGEPIDLSASPATRDLKPQVATGTKSLDVEYVPNMRPNRLIRGTPLGRSDYSGAEPIMDALDETWSSWMRDLRLAKGRLVAPEAFLESNGPGGGATFDGEREVWAGINTVPKLDGSGSSITSVQFAIRVQEHRDTAAAALRQIWRTAGYSVGENGEESESQAAATATEVVSRGARTAATRKRKMGYWAPALRRLIAVTLELDKATFRGDADLGDLGVSIEFPPAVASDPEAIARTANLLAQAQAASTKTLVEMVHPEWIESQVLAEVAAIQSATAPPNEFDDEPPADDELDEGDGGEGDEPPVTE